MKLSIIHKLQTAFQNKKKPAWKKILSNDELIFLKNININHSISRNARSLLFPDENILAPCGNEKNFVGFITGYAFSCADKCKICKKAAKINRINQFKKFNHTHGVSNASQIKSVVEKRKETCLRKYGKTTNLATEDTKNKIKATNLKKYGVENVSLSRQISIKKRNTYLKRYGVSNPSKSSSIIQKIQNSKKYYYNELRSKNKIKKRDYNLKTYGVIYPTVEDFQRVKFIKNKGLLAWKILKNPVYLQTLLNKYTIEEISQKYNISFSSIAQHSIRFNIRKKYQSSFETSVSKYIISLINDIKLIKFNSRPKFMNGLELDLYIPSLNFAIECNGLYWHKFHDIHYHSNKTDLCNNNQISLIHIWEDEWYSNREEIENAIAQRIFKINTFNDITEELVLPRDLYDNVGGIVIPPTERLSGGFNSGWILLNSKES